ncbi:glycosyl transferase [Rhodothalassium salexigens]|uniref:glycosyltransferase n=1 Tax=Rhodothalassium salexigens TaxID=1086 RepID=UPI0019148335|nr:glycosyltransferase family 8 protein [Rhodothalassium salexigens]MBK5912223.1 glycosyl transferase [Rhodothalassium salexigens]MBK5919984.1 glycosyl transferase [Rhodothalassium salexigens]
MSRGAYVTLVTNAEYGRGALALARSLKMVSTAYPLVVLATERAGALDALAAEGARIVPVDQPRLSDDFRSRHTREKQHAAQPFLKGSKPKFHDPLDNFCKLRLWQLDGYDRVVFLDADTLVVKPIDKLMGYPEFSAAPNVYESLTDFHRMNSGVFVARPDRDTYTAMLRHLDRPDHFWPRTDQTFLQDFFPDWYGLPWCFNTLQYIFFNLPHLWDWRQIRLVHYQYEKPWQTDHPKRDKLQPLIDLWHQVNDHGTLPERVDTPFAEPAEA